MPMKNHILKLLGNLVGLLALAGLFYGAWWLIRSRQALAAHQPTGQPPPVKVEVISVSGVRYAVFRASGCIQVRNFSEDSLAAAGLSR